MSDLSREERAANLALYDADPKFARSLGIKKPRFREPVPFRMGESAVGKGDRLAVKMGGEPLPEVTGEELSSLPIVGEVDGRDVVRVPNWPPWLLLVGESHGDSFTAWGTVETQRYGEVSA